LLHACCHNPTGVDPSPQQWQAIADILVQRQLLPLVDFAYQGFGAGLNEDAAGLRAILQSCEEAIVASSFSKNFGLYSERVGAVSVVAADADAKQSAHSQLKRLIRSNYSNPPRHGASIVATVLQDDALRQQWTDELSAMRSRIAEMRKQFVSGMQSRVPDQDFSFIKAQNGMFSFSGLNAMQVDKLRSQHSVYIVGSGRINVAGITPSNVDRLCDAIATVIT
ncbi:MAG: aminotransferase class I/II-fold pyridoxal phosphate-dependent enzyme, partial [Planctomycetota bacterium]